MKGKSRKTTIKFLDDMGLCLSNGAMVYGHEHGALRWAPSWVKHSICHTWNKVRCFFVGHDPLGYAMYTEHVVPGSPICPNCCAHLKIDGRYPTPEEVETHNELCHNGWEKVQAEWRLEHPEDELSGELTSDDDQLSE